MDDLSAWPGGDLVMAGVADLRAGRASAPALLVSFAPTSLRDLGIHIAAEAIPDPESKLYALLCERDEQAAYGDYKALQGQLVSFLLAASQVRPRSGG